MGLFVPRVIAAPTVTQSVRYQPLSTQQLYRYDRYKTRFCVDWPNKGSECEYGKLCPHAHSEQEISSQLIHHYDFDEDFYM